MQITDDRAVGIIPLHWNNGALAVCLVRSAKGDWGFPKGHVEKGETDEAAARRELYEETGIDAVDLLPDQIFSQSYAFAVGTSMVLKVVDYFVGVTDSRVATPHEFEGEITAALWLPYEEAKRRLSFDDTRRILEGVWQVASKRLE
jgi:8-oxo-dGTP pyrophosphatase MutT (NUDIX family)